MANIPIPRMYQPPNTSEGLLTFHLCMQRLYLLKEMPNLHEETRQRGIEDSTQSALYVHVPYSHLYMHVHTCTHLTALLVTLCCQHDPLL